MCPRLLANEMCKNLHLINLFMIRYGTDLATNLTISILEQNTVKSLHPFCVYIEYCLQKGVSYNIFLFPCQMDYFKGICLQMILMDRAAKA